jgi:hypothetical protein
MKTYVYSGPPSGVSLDNGEEILLFPNKTYPLPEENTYVQALVKLKYLKEVESEAAPKPTADKKATPSAKDKKPEKKES